MKLVAIVFALVSLAKMRRAAFADPNAADEVVASAHARRWAKAMLFFWGLAVLGGRLTAYATNIRIQSAAALPLPSFCCWCSRGTSFNTRVTRSRAVGG